MSAVFYFFMIKDTEGFIGEGIRNIFGSLSEKNVILLISFINVSTLGNIYANYSLNNTS